MFNKDEKIIYGQIGVCVVGDICEKEIVRGVKRKYYTLHPIYRGNSVIYSPIDSDKVFMRRIITKAEAEELIEKIPEIRERVANEDFNEEEEIVAHSCEELAEQAVKIYLKKQAARKVKKKLGFADERKLRHAEEMLFGELAEVLGISVEAVPNVLFANI